MKLKEIRKQLGFSQEDIANQLGVHNTTYGNWELGKTEPDIDNLVKLSKIFRTSIDHLLGLETEIINIKSLGDSEAYLIKKILKMNELELAKTRAYVTGLME